jgi:hypothetical protein
VRLGRLMGVHGARLLLGEGCGGYETWLIKDELR